MNLPRSAITTIATLAGVLSVPAVPGFAQTNTAAYADTLHSSVTAARVYVAARGPAVERGAIAPNLSVTRLYQAIVLVMLQRSPTFRRQYARLTAAPDLTVEIRSEANPTRYTPAWTTILRRGAQGPRHAIVHVVAGVRAVELIAHEIEHIIEQLDGVDLRHKSTIRSTGVRACECGDADMYETERAIAVGHQVAREVDGADERSR